MQATASKTGPALISKAPGATDCIWLSRIRLMTESKAFGVVRTSGY